MTASVRAAILIGLCLAALGLAWSAALAPAAGAGEGTAAPAPPAAPRAAAELPPLESFRETLERPLFVRGRRPPGGGAVVAAAGGPAEPPPSAPRLSVAGIAIAGGRRAALVVVEGRPKPVSLAEGGELSGWTVTAIAPDRIRLEKGPEAFEVALREFRRGG